MSSILYTRKYQSDFLIRNKDRVPSSGPSPSVFSMTLILVVRLHMWVITLYVTRRLCDAAQKKCELLAHEVCWRSGRRSFDIRGWRMFTIQCKCLAPKHNSVLADNLRSTSRKKRSIRSIKHQQQSKTFLLKFTQIQQQFRCNSNQALKSF